MAFERKHPKPKKRKPVLADLFEDEFEFNEPNDTYAVDADAALREYQEAPMRQKLAKRFKWQREVARTVYRHVDPKEIPLADLKIISHLSSKDHMDTKYADRVKGATTAVRSFCVNCQGGNIAFVRNCTAINCPLFPFRMGNNPFFGRIQNAEAEATEDFPEEPAPEHHDGNQEA